ncbi:MurR/RpiR family transcriptional regulator [Brucella sp. NBRC 113783]|uniref:MurR/RpiR family transcriptional regulator n=1 Tax=Brucella/Ochrobactrum group TaxID=2826938 RepID=UPI0029C029E7|nr:MurR/RpiR family transcriptional regulator [Brucella sp. NBRC 113783]MCI1002197.1 MurR/RpiR family transcriptional regulator [Ochrobactrum sp. C6C9]MDX4072080.1 MurR/RpiR family transcriptional regulator [Brucella sp. NBRC 113783]
MLQEDPLRARIIARFDEMSHQLQQAARYILEHPQDVAFVSMRELARNAGVQPSTITRLTKFLGLNSYEEIRSHHAQVIRISADGFAARALQNNVDDSSAGTNDLARRMLHGLSDQIARLCEPQSLRQLNATADYLLKARRVYVLGLRSCHSVAWNFHYVMTLLGDKTIHLDGPAGTGGDALMRATSDDALFVISINPYALQTLELAAAARQKGMSIVAITDSEVSPLVSIANQSVLISTESQTFFHTLTPALAVSEVLCGLLANRNRSQSVEALTNADRYLQSLNIYSSTIPRRKI